MFNSGTLTRNIEKFANLHALLVKKDRIDSDDFHLKALDTTRDIIISAISNAPETSLDALSSSLNRLPKNNSSKVAKSLDGLFTAIAERRQLLAAAIASSTENSVHGTGSDSDDDVPPPPPRLPPEEEQEEKEEQVQEQVQEQEQKQEDIPPPPLSPPPPPFPHWLLDEKDPPLPPPPTLEQSGAPATSTIETKIPPPPIAGKNTKPFNVAYLAFLENINRLQKQLSANSGMSASPSFQSASIKGTIDETLKSLASALDTMKETRKILPVSDIENIQKYISAKMGEVRDRFPAVSDTLTALKEKYGPPGNTAPAKKA